VATDLHRNAKRKLQPQALLKTMGSEIRAAALDPPRGVI
jgi:hypothetical protein